MRPRHSNQPTNGGAVLTAAPLIVSREKINVIMKQMHPKQRLPRYSLKRNRMTDKPLTPEILANAGWQKGDDTPYHVCYSLDLEEDFGKETDFAAFMMVTFIKRREIVKFDIERTFGDSIRSTFRRQITVGEFNTLLDIIKLEKFKIK